MTTPPVPPDFAALAARVDQLRQQVAGSPDAAVLQETLAAVTDFNRAGLAALVWHLRSDPAGERLLYEAVEDPAVMALFVAHGIVRADRTLDVLRALDQMRPHLAAVGVSVELLDVTGDVAHLGFGRGCAAPPPAVRDEVRAELLRRVSGLTDVVEVAQSSGVAFIALDELQVPGRG